MHSVSQTHATLLLRLADGTDPGAWAEFQARYADLIRGFCLRRGLQPADIDDVLQDVLLSMSKAMPAFRYDPAKGTFRGYLKTVVSHAISRKFRQEPPAAGLSHADAPADDAAGDEHWEVEWRRYHFRRAMSVLEHEFSARDIRAFSKYAVEGHEAARVAEEFGMGLDALYQIKSRVLKRLGQVIGSQVSEEG